LWRAMRTVGLRLWDESSKKLVGWRQLREVERQRQDGTPPS
jgi:hypothetical protein